MAILPPNLSTRTPETIITPEQKKQKKLIIIFLIIVLLIVLVLYFGFFASPKVPSVNFSPSLDDSATSLLGQEKSLRKEALSLEKVELDFSVFNDPKFQSLKDFGSSLDLSIAKGRQNPFIPY